METLVFADEQAVRGRLVLALIGAGPPGSDAVADDSG